MLEDTKVIGRIVAIGGAKITAVLDAPADGRLPASGVGRLVVMSSGDAMVYGQVGRMWSADPARDPGTSAMMAEIDILGEVALVDGPERFRCGVATVPALGSAIRSAEQADLGLVYGAPGESAVSVGTLHQDRGLPAFVVTDNLLGKHFAIAGASGSGKSCAVALILKAILANHPNGHVVILDPHGEYAASFGDMAEVIDLDTLQLPYWMMNLEEMTAAFTSSSSVERAIESAILRDLVVAARRQRAEREGNDLRVTVDSPVPFSLAELESLLQASMGRLEKPEGLAPFMRLSGRLQSMAKDRRFAFMFPRAGSRDSMSEVLGRVLRFPVSGRPVSIIDLSGVPSEIVDIAVSMLCRMIFDFSLWKEDADVAPVLLVCEEAHRYVPEDERLGFGPTRRAVARIAREGRKHGVSLCLVTQRPSEISAAILAQCNTLFVMRLANERDQAFARAALPDGTAGLLAAVPALQPQEAVAVGEGVTVPMRLRFADLPPAERPRSSNAPFSTAWQQDDLGSEFVAATIAAWRRQRRSAPREPDKRLEASHQPDAA